MSRSNPTDNTPNPSTRWFEWKGKEGVLSYWDKEKEQRVNVPDGFRFILLDELATVRGFNKRRNCGMYANEVRDTRQEVFSVKLFDGVGSEIACGTWQEIRDKVVAAGGHFTASLYIAYKQANGKLAIGGLQLRGSSFSPWLDFKKVHRQDIYSKAVQIKGSKKGQSGDNEFLMPVFHLCELSEDTNKEALELDKQLQEYLKGYFSRTKAAAAVPPAEEPDGQPTTQGRTAVANPAQAMAGHATAAEEEYPEGVDANGAPVEADDVPF